MVFQHYVHYPHMTIRDNMAFGLRNIDTAADGIAARVDAAAASLELGRLLDRKPGQISGGQRQRVAIARAIVKKPELFLFDEPLSNLDAVLRVRTRLKLAQLHQRLGTTIIFVTHDQGEAVTFADRIVFLNHGRIEQVGAPMELYLRPATAFVATFVGSVRIIMLPVTLVPDRTGKHRATRANGAVVDTAVSGELGREATLGLRAKHVRVAADGALRGTAHVVERLASAALCVLNSTAGSWLSRRMSASRRCAPARR